jgi:uncharacterized protein (UPF0276 family)
VQDALGRRDAARNPSTYIRFAERYPETDFLDTVVRRTGCGLLLDINNVYISARNHGTSAQDYLDRLPLARVQEIHLGGHNEQSDDAGAPLLIDAHGTPVADPVWALYAGVIERAGPLPTLIEWDNDIPPWPVLAGEARAAASVLERAGRGQAV